MKNHIDSNFAIAILALVAACVGFAFWFLHESDTEYKDSQLSNVDTVQGKADDERVKGSHGVEKSYPTFRYITEDDVENFEENSVVFGDSSGIIYSEDDLAIREIAGKYQSIAEGVCSKECYGGPFQITFPVDQKKSFVVTRSSDRNLRHSTMIVGSDAGVTATLTFKWNDMAGSVDEQHVYTSCDQEETQANECRFKLAPQGADRGFFASVEIAYENSAGVDDMKKYLEGIAAKPLFKTLEERLREQSVER